MAIKFMSLSALALTFALVQSPAALACSDMHKGDWVVKVAEKLHLSTEQKAKVNAYAHKTKIEIAEKRHELHDIGKNINETFHSGMMTETKLDGFAGQKTRLMGEIIKLKLQERYDVYQTLNAKQKAEMDHMVQRWEEKHH
ncbi:MAG: Spy/CpxP family protein refolding chaperone [Legionellales bacterium]|nr:Spy/CpxP family protein refolding chaperone [Legionellales bacterium]